MPIEASVEGSDLVAQAEFKTLSLRLLGTSLPGRITSGLFRTRGGGRQMWAVHRASELLVIDLHDERWDRLVLEVPDPAATAAAIVVAASPKT